MFGKKPATPATPATPAASARPEGLAPGGKLSPDAIDRFPADPKAVETALAEAADGPSRAALAIVAGARGLGALVPKLVPLLDDDGVAGRAAAWALGKIGGADVERALTEMIGTAGIVRRENAYAALATLAAARGATPKLADAMAARVEAEIERARSGRSGLGDRALRVLAVLGDGRVEEFARRIIEADRFANRVELDRLRKVMERDKRDTETIQLASGPWTAAFKDDLVPPPAAPEAAGRILSPSSAASRPAGAPAGKPAPGRPAPAGAPAGKGRAPAPPAPAQPDHDEAEPAPAPAGREISWGGFQSSAEVAALPARARPLAVQLGQLLDQVAAQAVGVPLAELQGQELVAVLLQVLPRALPPQHAQTALSPEALLCYEALARFLTREGLAAHGPELVEAVRSVRRRLREQVQRSGLIDGPDYSDPA